MAKVSSAGNKSPAPAKSSTPKSSNTSKSTNLSKPATGGSANATADRLNVNFRPDKDQKPAVNLDAWNDNPAADKDKAASPDKTAELKEALGDSTLRKGMQGDNVKALQQALNDKLGLKEGDEGFLDLDGKYGPATQSAVRKFQEGNESLKNDGIFGANTRDALLAPADKKETDQPKKTEEAPKNSEAAEQPKKDAAPAQSEEEKAKLVKLEEALGSGVMRKGMEGDNVKALQGALNDKLGLKEGQEGFLTADGKFGPATQSALKAFQDKHDDLKSDGVFGSRTREALLGREVGSSKAEETGQSQPAGEVADRYAKYKEHRELLARAVAAEARGEGFDTQMAVAQTVMNYANHKGKNLTSIVGNRNSAFLSSNQDGNKKFYTMPTSQIPNWERTLKAVDQAFAGKSAVGSDRIYFHDNSIRAPRWTDTSTRLSLGRMRFYEER